MAAQSPPVRMTRVDVATDTVSIFDGTSWHKIPSSALANNLPSPPLPKYSAYDMLELRLGKSLVTIVEHGSIFRNDTTTFVTIVHKGQGVLLEDDSSLYPSDALIAKIRLIIA